MLSHVRSRPLPRRPNRFWPWLDAVFRTARHRRELSTLDPHLKRDLGLSDMAVRRERERPFWDIPDWWR